jgi:hypothetical protein
MDRQNLNGDRHLRRVATNLGDGLKAFIGTPTSTGGDMRRLIAADLSERAIWT